MENRINFITLGVNDFEAMTQFYQEIIGWKKVNAQEGIAFYKMNGFFLALYPAKLLAEDIGIPDTQSGVKYFTLAINFNSREEVDALFKELKDKGVKIAKSPEEVFWGGYSGYFSDPEGNYWEVAHNPFLVMDEEGNSVTHP